jgi:hypothetical protein
MMRDDRQNRRRRDEVHGRAGKILNLVGRKPGTSHQDTPHLVREKVFRPGSLISPKAPDHFRGPDQLLIRSHSARMQRHVPATELPVYIAYVQ